ncbi:MAG: hypothetical protein PHO94_12565 [Petrimonas sp.]|nr:hypothetical protein [Petrimonas sp.]
MKKIILLSILGLVISVSGANAQSFFDKIDNIANKVDKAAKSADKVSKTGGKVMSLFSSKKGEEAAHQTTISVSGIGLTALKSLNAIVESAKEVSETQMKFNAAESTIVVNHSGSTEDLLMAIQPESTEIFTDENIVAFEDGLIKIKLK